MGHTGVERGCEHILEAGPALNSLFPVAEAFSHRGGGETDGPWESSSAASWLGWIGQGGLFSKMYAEVIAQFGLYCSHQILSASSKS